MAGFYLNSFPNAVPPVFTPGTGHYGAAQSVSLASPTATQLGGVIHYAIGATATCGSPTYSGPINVTSTQTITALVCGVAGYNQSNVTTGAYAITGNTTPQTFYVNATTGAGLYSVPRQTVGGSQGLFTGSAIGCTGLASTPYPGGSAIQQNCPLNDWRFLFDPQIYNNSDPNTWLMQGGDTAIISGCATNPQNSGNTTAPDCRAGVDNNTGIGAGQTWCYGGGVNGCANPAMPSGVKIAAATACSITGGVGTITAPNTLSAGAVVMPDYFTTAACKPFNGQVYTVLGSGLSSSQFQVLITSPNASSSDTGSVFRPTRLIGANVGACTVDANKQVIFGGFGVGAALDLSGAQHVDVECLNVTRHSQCIQFGSGPGSPTHCVSGDDYDSDGIHTSIATSGVFMQDVWTHGHPGRGVKGPIGGVVTCNRCSVDTNGSAGWDFDDGFGTAPDGLGNPGQEGTASVNGQWNFLNSYLKWSGCNQQYPFTSATPILACFGQSNQGYGDGVGSPPGGSFGVYWNGDFCMYNTQDCLDIGHADAGGSGSGYNDQTFSPYLVTNSLAFGNSGGNWKSGPNTSPATITNTVVVGNCQRMAYPITGVPSTFNANLSDFCRAGSNISLNFHSGGTITMSNNTFVTYFSTAFLIQAWEGAYADPLTTLNFQNNLVYGLQDALPPLNQDYGGNSGGIGGFFFNTSGNPAEAISTNNRTNNLWYGVRSENCGSFPTDVCADPLFVNPWSPCLVSGGSGCTFTEPTWDALLPTVTPTPSYNIQSGSPAINAGVTCSGCPTTGYNGVAQTSPPTIGANPRATSTPTVATPVFTPGTGTYSYPPAQTPVGSISTIGAIIGYTTDGSTPTASTPGIVDHGTTLFTNLQNQAGPQPNWVACFLPSCDPGGSGLGTATVTFGSTALSSDSLILTVNGNNVNGLAYRHLPVVSYTGVTGMTEDEDFYIPSTTTHLQAMEFDPDLFTGTHKYFASMQCRNDGKWYFWNTAIMDWTLLNSSGGTIPTYSCSLLTATNVAHHFHLEVSVDTTAHTYTYNTMIIDGVTVYSGLGNTYAAITDSGTATVNIEQQLDNDSTATTNVVYYANLKLLMASAPLSIATTTTVKAIGTAAASTNSGLGTFVYTINPIPPVATPTSAPAPGPYVTAVSVTLLDSTPSSTICYTLDGSTPTALNGVCTGTTLTYSSPIALSTTTTIKAIGSLNGAPNSSVGNFTYTITSVSPPFSAGGNITFGGKITQ